MHRAVIMRVLRCKMLIDEFKARCENVGFEVAGNSGSAGVKTEEASGGDDWRGAFYMGGYGGEVLEDEPAVCYACAEGSAPGVAGGDPEVDGGAAPVRCDCGEVIRNGFAVLDRDEPFDGWWRMVLGTKDEGGVLEIVGRDGGTEGDFVGGDEIMCCFIYKAEVQDGRDIGELDYEEVYGVI